MVYVPERILTGICFPKAEVQNTFPHLTIMTCNNWKPVHSNIVLEATCKDPEHFKYYYEELASSQESAEQMIKEACDFNVSLGRNKVEKVGRAYLIVFD